MPTVIWTSAAEADLPAELRYLLHEELGQVFAAARRVVVLRRFRSYTRDEWTKTALGVEVRLPDRADQSWVVKIGRRSDVERDFENWQRCVAGQQLASRVLVGVASAGPLPLGDRSAILYQDAHTFFTGLESDAAVPAPLTLEEAFCRAVEHDAPEATSVERVVRHIFGDLYRCFYRTATTAPRDARAFYLRRLRGPKQPGARWRPAWRRWQQDAWRVDLRRDLLWLFCGKDEPASTAPPTYLDPLDYACWAFRTRNLPATLVGTAHGDLHGRNVIVGVPRGEAEYPAVYDYGDLRTDNVIVWDFVKLEMELKVRVLNRLYGDREAQQVLLSEPPGHNAEQPRGPRVRLRLADGASAERPLRCHQAAFAFAFENLLNQLTDCIQDVTDASSSQLPGLHPPGSRCITGHVQVDRALVLLLRIRQEAALCLGDWQAQRRDRGLWRAEYYFALLVYGLNVAKFKTYETPEYLTSYALVCAGVSAAELEQRRPVSRSPSPPYASYREPLRQARGLWNQGQSAAAVRFLEPLQQRYAHAVPLTLEYGLVLTDAGEPGKAVLLLQGLDELCRVFGDVETLSRLGGACKRWGDRALADRPVQFADFPGHPAWDLYAAAYQRYRAAFDIAEAGERYYPGVNAATLARFRGEGEEAQRIARVVLDDLDGLDLLSLSPVNRFWMQASRGEAALVLGDVSGAAAFYAEALRLCPAENTKAPQVAYDQLCRLHWALGEETVGPVLTVFRQPQLALRAGPLGDGRWQE